MNLGIAREARAKLEEDIITFREEARLRPDHAEAHRALGRHFGDLGNYAGSLAMYHMGHELKTRLPGRDVASSESGLAMAERLEAISDRPWPCRAAPTAPRTTESGPVRAMLGSSRANRN